MPFIQEVLESSLDYVELEYRNETSKFGYKASVFTGEFIDKLAELNRKVSEKKSDYEAVGDVAAEELDDEQADELEEAVAESGMKATIENVITQLLEFVREWEFYPTRAALAAGEPYPITRENMRKLHVGVLVTLLNEITKEVMKFPEVKGRSSNSPAGSPTATSASTRRRRR